LNKAFKFFPADTSNMVDITKEVREAEQRISRFVLQTPIEYSFPLSKLLKANVYLKLENLQITGSFKIRGAFNKILSLSEEQRKKGFITASTGNHGLAVSYALKELGYKGTIFLPHSVIHSKIKAFEYFPVQLKFIGKGCEETENYAREFARKYNKIYISPYNDEKIIGGQGTIGLEISKQLKKFDYVLASVGGGGMISGIAGYLKKMNSSVKITGCLPVNSPVMYESIKADKIVNMKVKPTISDGTVGGIEPEAITFKLCKKLVDDWILVSEAEIKEAIKFMLMAHHYLIEGAAGVTVASAVKNKKRFTGKTIVLILCGRNISLELLKKIL